MGELKVSTNTSFGTFIAILKTIKKCGFEVTANSRTINVVPRTNFESRSAHSQTTYSSKNKVSLAATLSLTGKGCGSGSLVGL